MQLQHPVGQALLENLEKVIVGKTRELSMLLVGVLAEGHLLLEDVPGVAVVPKRAEGQKCQRSWKILPEVGSVPGYPGLSPRDAEAVREYDARAQGKKVEA
mgnify:CR=1 FL=1